MIINCQSYYCVSKEVIARKIEGELVIVPMISGVGNLDSEMYALNETGAALWEKLDGETILDDVIHELAKEFNTSYDQIKNDVLDILKELITKELVVEK
ncbi:MAG: PqqD family protein [Desulfobacula sp.]|uniref:PqqD family protein n=1 Tax=Desulfobacula sp. TaxID=2593537 RepID=UPI0025BF8400|nr:PqqD family protein [Desulfobacula sp.]MCD4720395.1 PqqD family protein [Desulfobacula sp.]